MADFDKAIPWVLEHEGGFVDHPSDPGGATNFGISLRFLLGLDDQLQYDYDGDGDVDADDIKALTIGDAHVIYEKEFWHPLYDAISSQMIATKLFDMAVNMGTRQAVKIIQLSMLRHAALSVDGIFGNKTLSAINNQQAGFLIDDISAEQAKFYFKLVDKRPARNVFLLGWLRRAYAIPEA